MATPAKAIGASFTRTVSDGKVTITGYNGSQLAALVIPETLDGLPVVSIGEDAFQNLTFFTSVTIPDSVTSMKNFVFSGCSGLTSVKLSSNVTNIGESTFYNCSSLTSVTIPESVSSIDGFAFYGCSSLTSVTIPRGVTNIGNEAFKNCSALVSANFLGNAPTMGTEVFARVGSGFKVYYSYYSDQTGFTEPTWSGYSVGNLNRFKTTATGANSVIITGYPQTAVGALVIPAALDGESVVGIEGFSFANCSSLTSVTIPASVTSIGGYAFSNCSSLASVTIPASVTSIGGNAFDSCSSLTRVTIPAGVTRIEGETFYGCFSLTSVTIPASVTSIGDNAFTKCRSLTSVTIPASVARIGRSVFDSCSSLMSASFLGNAPTLGENPLLGTSSSLVLYRRKSATGYDVPPWTGFNLGFNDPPAPWMTREIGAGEQIGYTIFLNGTYTQAGSGAFGSTSDKFRFTYQTLSGDGQIVARISSLGQTGNSARVGVMMRDGLVVNAPHVFVGLNGNGGFRQVERLAKGSKNATKNRGTGSVSAAWVRLVRKENVVKSYTSISGDKWTLVATTKVTLAKNCHVGLVVASGSESNLNTSEFTHVKVKR